MGKRRCDAAYNSFFLLAADDIWLRAVGVAIKFQLLLHFSHTAHAEAAKEMAMGKRPTRMGNENGYGIGGLKMKMKLKMEQFLLMPNQAT